MKTLICTVGLPLSGKTTWAVAFAKDHGTPIVCPDAIRLAMHGQRFSKEAEPFVWAMAKCMTRAMFGAGHDTVILDATNTTRARRDEWKSSAWRTFFHHLNASADECVARALSRLDEAIVPVIRRQEVQFEPLGTDELSVLPLGATGLFPDGAIHPTEDEGELRFAIATDKKAGIVRLEFGKPVAWLGLPRKEAQELGERLQFHASKLD